jgi:hypothetical protein
MKRPIQLPMITFRGKRYFADVRLGELREVDVLATLSFQEFGQIATPKELDILIAAIHAYYCQFDVER